MHLMQIAGDKSTKLPHLVSRFEKVRHHDRHHAGRRRRSNAVVRVFEGQTETWLDPEPLGSLQKRIGRRLAFFVVAVSDNLIETARKTVGCQVSFDGLPG